MSWYKDEPRAITLARLKVIAPQLACEDIKAFNEFHQNDPFHLRAFEELEAILQERNDPLINLALARYGASRSIVGALYDKALAGTGDAEQDLGIRIGVLTNRVVSHPWFLGAKPPISLAELQRLAEIGGEEELQAMLQNPSFGELLEDLYLV